MSKLLILVLFLTAYTTGTPHAGSFRIFGGKVARVGAYPFMVSLRWYPDEHFCGGTIVSNLWVLTAAHCVDGESIATVFAVVGTNSLNFGGVAVKIRKIVMHPNFKDTEHRSNDIAMIQLHSALSFSANIAPVILDTVVFQSTIDVTLIGWGETRNKGPSSNYLREVSTQTLSQAACSLYWPEAVNANHICTKFQNETGFFSTDSGGPLIRTNTKTQVGVISFHFYGRVSSYVSWIRSTANLQG
ncbi:hypothetical protein Trydic_g12380 [Trypoxylus dichotomus]